MVEPISSTFPSRKTATATPYQLNTDAPLPAPSPWQPPSYSLCLELDHTRYLMQGESCRVCLSLCDWLISLSTMSSRFIYVWCVRISFLLKAEWYSSVWMDHFSFIHSLPTGNLGCFHFLVAVNNAALDIGIQLTLFFLFSLPLSPSPSFWFVIQVSGDFTLYSTLCHQERRSEKSLTPWCKCT